LLSVQQKERSVPVRRLNHAVLFVRDVERSVAFYRDVLGFAPIEGMAELKGAAFLRAPSSTNDHDLGLFEVGAQAGPSGAGRATVGLYHLAWEVETLADLAEVAQRLTEHGALAGATDHSTTKALYGKDPDGLEFEVCWLVPADRLTPEILAGRDQLAPLDLTAELERFGPGTVGGLGISVPATA
jgi:catechol-2,3-dioxygenase